MISVMSLRRLLSHHRWPLLIYAAGWTAVLTVTVAVSSFSPEVAFVSAVTPTKSSVACSRHAAEAEGSIRIPLDVPSEVICLPTRLLGKSKMDMIVPPIFAAVIVAGSAFAVKALGLWEVHDDAI